MCKYCLKCFWNIKGGKIPYTFKLVNYIEANRIGVEEFRVSYDSFFCQQQQQLSLFSSGGVGYMDQTYLMIDHLNINIFQWFDLIL